MTPAIAAVVAMYGAFMVVGWLASRKVRRGAPADLIVAGRQPALISYPETLPFRTLAAAAGLVLLPLVSRATARWDEARPLPDAVAAPS